MDLFIILVNATWPAMLGCCDEVWRFSVVIEAEPYEVPIVTIGVANQLFVVRFELEIILRQLF